MCTTPLLVRKKGMITGESQKANATIPVPCGKCPLCIKKRIQQWVFRIKKELERSTSALFITLTYDEKNLPRTEQGTPTLRKKDLQDFIKRLRHYDDATIKYFGCGEYGEKRGRPHYHLFLFNLTDERNINRAWGKGLTDVSPPKYGDKSVRYILGYMKKATKKVAGQEKEFSLMSKRLGDNYLTPAMIKYHQGDIENRAFATLEGGYKISLPKYYKDKLYNESQRKQLTRALNRRISEIEKEELRKFSKNRKGLGKQMVERNLELAKRNVKFDKRNDVL